MSSSIYCSRLETRFQLLHTSLGRRCRRRSRSRVCVFWKTSCEHSYRLSIDIYSLYGETLSHEPVNANVDERFSRDRQIIILDNRNMEIPCRKIDKSTFESILHYFETSFLFFFFRLYSVRTVLTSID